MTTISSVALSGASPRRDRGKRGLDPGWETSPRTSECAAAGDRSPSAYDAVVRPFIAKIRPIVPADDMGKYEGFLGKFNNRHGVRAKRLNKRTMTCIRACRRLNHAD